MLCPKCGEEKEVKFVSKYEDPATGFVDVEYQCDKCKTVFIE